MSGDGRVLNSSSAAPLRLRKGDAVYSAVEQAILLGHLAPGQTLVEQQIGGEFGCSQGTVREALLRLEQAGLVSRRGYQGTFVSDMTATEAALMVQIRIMIETLGISRSAPNMSDSTIATLNEILDQLSAAEAASDDYAASRLDRLFHLTILQASGLTALEPILKRCCLHMHRFTFGKAQREARASYNKPSNAAQHRAILSALTARNPEGAAQAMRKHIEAVIDFWAPDLKSPSAGDGAATWDRPTPRPPTGPEPAS